MDHSENDKRFCVYVLKDIDDSIRYVGHGSKYRPNVKNRNNKELMEIIDRLEPEIIADNLSKNDAISLEAMMFEKYISSGKLLNKFSPAKIKKILLSDIEGIVYYDETSPTFLRWKVDIKAGRFYNRTIAKKDTPAGTIKKDGYVETSINRVLYKNHRLIWVLNNKSDLVSNLVIDHIDRNKTNNNINNLRLVTQKENVKNSSNRRITESGFEGISINKERCFVYVRWPVGFGRKSKTFNYGNLFPNIENEAAMQKCIELAVWYRNEILTSLEKENNNGI